MSHYSTHTNLWDEVRSVMFPGATSIPAQSTDAIKATTAKAVKALWEADIRIVKLGENTWLVPRKRLERIREIIAWVHNTRSNEKPTK